MTWEVNLGSILIIASIVFSAGGFYYVSRFENRGMKEDITDIKADLKTLNKVVMDVALQNVRLDNQGERVNLLEQRLDARMSAMERRWEEMRRGEGMITTERRS